MPGGVHRDSENHAQVRTGHTHTQRDAQTGRQPAAAAQGRQRQRYKGSNTEAAWGLSNRRQPQHLHACQ